MGGFVAKVRQWWTQPTEGPSVPFAVACACGQVVRGLRRSRFQAIACGACGRPVFVLGLSPLPPQHSIRRIPAPSTETAARASTSFRLRLFIAGGVTLVLVIAVYAVLLVLLAWRIEPLPPPRPEELHAHLHAGQRALAEGNFRLASDELNAALALRNQNPQALTPIGYRRLLQLQRQADLLADLLSESLQEILRRAAGLRDPEEWQAQFVRRYQGRSVVFDDTVGRDAAGRHALAVYEVRIGNEPVRVEFEGLKLLDHLPLNRPARLLFGARLASVGREPPGLWVIRFEPDSGVLITDAGAAAACCGQPLDEEMEELLRRQNDWAAGLP